MYSVPANLHPYVQCTMRVCVRVARVSGRYIAFMARAYIETQMM